MKPRVKLSEVTVAGAENDDPHEEALGLGIAVLGAFDDVATLRGDRVGDRRDDAAAVVAGEGEHETRRFSGHEGRPMKRHDYPPPRRAATDNATAGLRPRTLQWSAPRSD